MDCYGDYGIGTFYYRVTVVQISLWAEDTTGRSSFKEGKLVFDTRTLIEWDYPNNVSQIVFENFAIVTENNGKEVKRVDVTDEVKNAEGFTEGIVALEFTDTYEVVEGDAVSIYVAAILFYLTAIINIVGGNNTSMGIVWLCLGSTFLGLDS